MPNTLMNVEINESRTLLQVEKELIAKLKLGETNGVGEGLKTALGLIGMANANDTQIIKAKVLELILVLSRAAVDGGADSELVSQINTQFVLELTHHNVGDLSKLVEHTLEKFLQEVTQTKIKNNQMVRVTRAIKEYISANYHRRISLEDIAEAVCLSPYYVCHVFKQVRGITIIDYLNEVRIEKAKQLLGNRKYNIHEISSILGYKDPSYFAKVFRQKEGTSPSQYRRQA